MLAQLRHANLRFPGRSPSRRWTLGAVAAAWACLLAWSSPVWGQESEIDKLLKQAEMRTARGDHEGAVLALSGVIQLDPKHSQAYLLRGKAKYAMRLPRYALSDYTKAIELDPKNFAAYRERGYLRTYNSVGNYDDAIGDFEQAIKAGVAVAQCLSDRGFARFYQGELVAGVEDATQAIALGVQPGFYFNRAQCRFGLGDYAGALEDFDLDLADSPNFAASYPYRACCHLLLGNEAKAQADFAQHLKLNPNGQANVDNQKALAQILLAKPEPESAADFVKRANLLRSKGFDNEAVSDCSRALVVDPNHVPALVLRASVLNRLSFRTSAAADYGRAIAVEPNYPDHYYNRANIYYSDGKYAEALADGAKTLELEERYFSAMNIRGLAYLDLLQFDDAIRELSTLVKKNAAANNVHYGNLGNAQLQSGDFANALVSLNKAIELQPQDLDSLVMRAQAHRALGNVEAALKDLAQAEEVNPKDSWPLEHRAIIHMLSGKYKEAAADLDRSAELAPFATESFRLRGLMEELRGNLPAALEQLDLALMWNPLATEAMLTRSLLRLRSGDAAGSQADQDVLLKLLPHAKARAAALSEKVKTGTVASALYPLEKAGAAASSTTNAPATPAPAVPKLAQMFFDKGLGLFAKEEFEAADAEFRKAITLFPRYADAHLYRGLIQLRAGNSAEADRSFAEALRFRPELKDAIEEERAKIKPK